MNEEPTAPPRGRRPKLGPDQVAELVAQYLKDPRGSGHPHQLAAAFGVSTSTVYRCLGQTSRKGRPTVLTPGQIDDLRKLHSKYPEGDGHPSQLAAAFGVSTSTVYRLLRTRASERSDIVPSVGDPEDRELTAWELDQLTQRYNAAGEEGVADELSRIAEEWGLTRSALARALDSIDNLLNF